MVSYKTKWIKGYEGQYKISSDGSVISYKQNKIAGKLLKPKLVNNYYVVDLISEGVHEYCYVHRLVADAFIPKPKDGLSEVVKFKSADTTNVKPSNLSWMSTTDKLKSQHKTRRSNLTKKGMITSSFSVDDAKLVATILNGNSVVKGKVKLLTELLNSNRMAINRLTKHPKYKMIVKEMQKF